MKNPRQARKLVNRLNAGVLFEYQSKRDTSTTFKRREAAVKYARIVSFVLTQTCTIRQIKEDAFK